MNSKRLKKYENSVLLTGATGLIGSYLLKVLLQHGHTVCCVARHKNNKSATMRVKEMLTFWDKSVIKQFKNNLTVVEGDITKPCLGLIKRNFELITSNTSLIFHSAASTDLTMPLQLSRKINVEGTQRVIDFARRCKRNTGFVKLNHLSTAYVCGDFQGVFKESDLEVGQNFKTFYEKSKFEAEKEALKARKAGLEVEIFRPAVVIGESQTGKIDSFKNIYNLFHIQRHDVIRTLPLLGYATNIVAVDQVAKVIYALSFHTTLRNRTYHIFPKNNISFEKLLKISTEYFKCKKIELIAPHTIKSQRFSPVEKTIMNKINKFFGFKVTLDSSYTLQLLEKMEYPVLKVDSKLLINNLQYYIKNNKVYG